jgi:hypothetical protein
VSVDLADALAQREKMDAIADALDRRRVELETELAELRRMIDLVGGRRKVVRKRPVRHPSGLSAAHAIMAAIDETPICSADLARKIGYPAHHVSSACGVLAQRGRLLRVSIGTYCAPAGAKS